MRYIFLSDIHGHVRRLEIALSHIAFLRPDRIIFLGDIGGGECFRRLFQIGAIGVFGNWEVSGWDKLAEPVRQQVLQLPAFLEEDDFIAAHSLPAPLAGMGGPAQVRERIQQEHIPWRALFPYLSDADIRWQAWADLLARRRRILFHGHTHQQMSWALDAQGRERMLRGNILHAAAGTHYLIGIGSICRPDDGPGIAFVSYDAAAGMVQWHRLPEPK
ncbi:MAG: metallophosphoesterase family protein [Anaerolineae bacterium]